MLIIPIGPATSPLRRYQRRVGAGEFRVDRAQLAAIRQLNALHRTLTANKRNLVSRLFSRRWDKRGIYLWGGVGTGKTLIMDVFFRALPQGMGWRIHFHRFMQWVHDEKNRMRAKQDPLAVIGAQIAAKHKVLCLDEFAVTDITDAMILSGLLHHLFDNRVTVVTTSNAAPDDLYKDGLQRRRFLPAIELIKNQMRIVRVDGGNDYRMNYLKSESLYHVPHDERAVGALWRSFVGLEGNRGDNKDFLTLSGRAVDIIAAGCGTAWFSFAALCEGNRSKLDYIELSKRFHTIILSDIPLLDAERENAARRVIELVDEMYDRGVNLMASAAHQPQDLYAGKKLREPFKRTASRLQEMSSPSYLARPHLS